METEVRVQMSVKSLFMFMMVLMVIPTLLSSRVEHGGAHRLKPDVRKCKFDC